MIDWSPANGAVGISIAIVTVVLLAVLRMRRKRRRRFSVVESEPAPALDSAEFHARRGREFQESVTHRLTAFLSTNGFIAENVELKPGWAAMAYRSADCRLFLWHDWKKEHAVNAMIAPADKDLPATRENGWRYVWDLLHQVDAEAHRRLSEPLRDGQHYSWQEQLDQVAGLLERHYPQFLEQLRASGQAT